MALMARMIGPKGIGMIALFGAVSTLASSIFKSTSSETVMVYTAKADGAGDASRVAQIVRHCYFLDTLTSLAAFGMLVVLSLYSPKLLNLPAGSGELQVLFGLTIIFQSTHWTSHGLLRVADRFSWTFYQSCAHSLFKVLAVAALFFAGKGLSELVLLLVGISLLDGASLTAMAFVALRKRGIHLNNGDAWWKVPKEVWRFQILCHARQIVKSLNRYVDTLLIGHLADPQQVGYYRAGKQICEQIITPAQGFLVSLFPEYSRLYFAGDMVRLRKMAKRFSMLLAGLAICASAVLFWGAEPIVRIILGPQFLPAVDLVHILIISTFILLAMYPLYSLPAATGKAAPALASVVIAISIQAILMLYLIPRYQTLGAAWAYVGYVVTWAIVMLPSVIRTLREQPVSKPANCLNSLSGCI